MENSQKQTAATPNNIENNKKAVPKTASLLSGWIANSFNGGHNRTIAYKQVMAGEKHFEYGVNLNIKLLTPKTPTYQNLKCTITAYFVPNSRVWTNAEKFTAQKGGTSVEKIDKVPNLTGKSIIYVPKETNSENNEQYTSYLNTTWFRDSWISSYIPRISNFEERETQDTTLMPAISALPLRGRIAIYNDFERNKEYDSEETEYKGDTISNEEWQRYLYQNANTDLLHMRAKRPNSYYTNYRTEVQGQEMAYPPANMSSDTTLNWLNWENSLAEARAEAMNANANDWDIIAKLRGTKPALQGKVQILGKKTFNLNYATVTQNTYNTSNEIADQFRVLGQQGAYSYTNINLPLYNGVEFIEEGYIHIIANVWAETVFEKGIDRTLLNIKAMDQYRPDLKEQKQDVLYEDEINGNEYYSNPVKGFKRKFSEYFKLPNCISGDMVTDNYYETGNEYYYNTNNQVITNKTYQFFERKDYEYIGTDGISIAKKPWKDFTDLHINKNQAILNDVVESDVENDIYVSGPNQIMVLGTHYCKAELPIDEEIKAEVMEWGEH